MSQQEIEHNGTPVFTLKVRGPHEAHEADHTGHLLSQLAKIPRDIKFLRIEEETPSDIEWDLMGGHFTSIKNLEMDTGFPEDLNDEKMPLHWPLERFLVSSACGEVLRSPFVIEGKVKHLVLLLTSGLRFEGPTSKELTRANEEAISRGEKEGRYITVREGTPEEKKIEVINISELALEWMREKYGKLGQQLEEEERNRIAAITTTTTTTTTSSHDEQKEEQPLPLLPKKVSANITKLEILENDAIDAFNRMTLALPHLVENLSTLNIRSTHGLDFHFTPEDLFACLLPQLTDLKTLVLSVGEVFKSDTFLPTLYKHFPPNISTLRFRGPVSLARSEEWKEWMEKFSSEEFLPGLRRLSFVLDMDYEDRNKVKGESKEDSIWGTGRKLVKPSNEMLREAQEACKLLYAAVERRGVVVEPFHDEWAAHAKIFDQVDERWMKL